MKKQRLILALVGIIVLALIFTITSCKKDKEALPKVETSVIEEISGSTALAGGKILDIGSHPIISQGVCYSNTKTNPTIADICIEDETFSQSFQVLVENLIPEIGYYIRAYAQNEIGISYGNVRVFYTIDGLPNVETLDPEEISFSSALVYGLIHDEGNSHATSRGICYATDSLFPNLQNNCIEALGDDNLFEVLLEDLMPETSYYIRAFAVNRIDSAFGKTKSFKTLRGIPELITKEAEDVQKTSALLGGEILNPGYLPVTRQGICYSQENANPDFNDICLDYNGSDQVFQILIEDLSPSNEYYFSAFAENDLGYHFGESISFTTVHETITDLEGNIYRIHTIGEQIWMVDNLRATKFSNGDSIPLREQNSYWVEGTAIDEPAYSWYHNDESYAELYGALYNFAVASDSRNVCPEGWRVMTDDDVFELVMGYLGGSLFGGNLKTTGTIEAGTGLWYAPNKGATNSSGFNAVPAGFRHSITGKMGEKGAFWTSHDDISTARAVSLDYDWSQVNIDVLKKHYGLSIRCLKE